MAICNGQNDDHCCWLGRHGQCKFLAENVNGRRWSCSLRANLGSWEAVHTDVRYMSEIQPIVRELVGVDCGDWPRPGELCHTCGGDR